MPQRLRRLGSASAAVSAGALVVLLAAPAAEASAETCKKGVDPETTIENWKCNLGNLREALTPKTPTPTPAPTHSAPAKPAPDEPAGKPPSDEPSKAPHKKAPRRPAPSGGQAAAPSGPSAMTDMEGLKPLSGQVPPTASELTGVLPAPEIAADPNAYRYGNAALPQTRLVSPVAAARQDSGRLLLVAAAAGAAGALNVSVAGRALRHRRTTR